MISALGFFFYEGRRRKEKEKRGMDIWVDFTSVRALELDFVIISFTARGPVSLAMGDGIFIEQRNDI